MIDPGLSDKVVVVTGANNPHGIGAAIARAFAAQGSKIFLHYYRPQNDGMKQDGVDAQSLGEAFYRAQSAKGAEEVLDSLDQFNVEATSWEADLSELGNVQNLFDEVESSLGSAEVLVHNAASWAADTFLPADVELPNPTVEEWTDRPDQITPESFETNFSVSARAAALLMAEFGKRHIEANGHWGRVINISTDGAQCFPSEISYGASKLALEGYSRSAAVEFGQFGITVNIVAPGPIQTGWITPSIEKSAAANTPLGRVGRPEDVADVVIFLASEQARWVTGQLIYVGGGHQM